jgi:hypothetical protein
LLNIIEETAFENINRIIFVFARGWKVNRQFPFQKKSFFFRKSRYFFLTRNFLKRN